MWLGRTMTLTGEQPRAGIAGHCRSDTAKLVGCAWFLDERQERCSGLIAMGHCCGLCRWAAGD